MSRLIARKIISYIALFAVFGAVLSGDQFISIYDSPVLVSNVSWAMARLNIIDNFEIVSIKRGRLNEEVITTPKGNINALEIFNNDGWFKNIFPTKWDHSGAWKSFRSKSLLPNGLSLQAIIYLDDMGEKIEYVGFDIDRYAPRWRRPDQVSFHIFGESLPHMIFSYRTNQDKIAKKIKKFEEEQKVK